MAARRLITRMPKSIHLWLRSRSRRTDGDYRERITELKRREAELQNRIDLLEQRLKDPPPPLPAIPREKPKPPPVRD